MQPVLQAVLRSWSIPPVATFAVALTALTYLRGTWLLRRAGYPYLPGWKIASFLLGLFALWFALASPFDTFNSFLLTAHMLQHMMLMMIAPPLILLGEPLIPIVRGMPRFAAREFAGPFLNWPLAERVGLALTHPVVALLLMGLVMFVWHVPGPYELALRSSAWHQTEHACFFFVSIVFWWPVVQPWPSRSQWPRWAMVPYLVIADLQNTILSAVLVFSDKILYPSYASVPRLFGLSPQEDQAAAGAIMWVVGSLAFVVPAVLIAVQCLTGRRVEGQAPVRRREQAGVIDPLTGSSAKRSDSRVLGLQLTSRSFEAISFVVLFLGAATGFALLSRSGTDDSDDRVLRATQKSGPFAISVYGPAGEIPVGASTFAVLVQDAGSQSVSLDTSVELSLRRVDSAQASTEPVQATADDENKLLFSADLEATSEGEWIVEARVTRTSVSSTVRVPIDVGKPEAEVAIAWMDVVIFAVAAVLGASYFWRHRARGSTGLAAPVT